MSTILQFGLDNRPVFNLAGLRALLLVNTNQITNITPSVGDKDVIDSITLVSGVKWNLFNEPDSLTFDKTPDYSSKSGTLYKLAIGFTNTINTTAKNQLFRTMAKGELTAIVQDKNNRWWLVGEEIPLRVTEAPSQINSDVNQTSIKLTGIQRSDVKQLSQAWVNALTADSFTSMLDTVDGGTSGVTLGGALNNGAGTNTTVFLGNNYQNTITAPPSGYTITSDIGIVFASPGTTIKLPSAARVGQQHLVKDYQGGALAANILVDGNSHTIDGNSVFKISTNYGAITFTYSASGWMTSAYIN